MGLPTDLNEKLKGIGFYSFDDVKLETVFKKLEINRLESSPLGDYYFCDTCGTPLLTPLTKSLKKALIKELNERERVWAVNALSHLNVYSCNKGCGKLYYTIRKSKV